MNNQGSYNFKGPILLFLASFIWGTAFVAQSVGTEYMGPFTFNMSRSLLGGLFLLPVIGIIQKIGSGKNAESAPEREDPEKRNANRKLLIIGGISCGTILCISSNLQQIGIQYTTVGKAGFITAMYIILVPVFSLFLHKKAGIKLWLSVAISVAGLYLLCMSGGSFSVGKGDAIVFLCAVTFSFHILAISYFSPKVDGVKMSCIQFWTAAILSGICMLIFEDPNLDLILEAWLPLCYAGILSSGVAFTFQIVGQKDLNPTVASLIMSLESVISAVAGWVILDEVMSPREIFGCVLMFAAIILAQFPEGRPKKFRVPSENTQIK